jgi:hypothetical protein
MGTLHGVRVLGLGAVIACGAQLFAGGSAAAGHDHPRWPPKASLSLTDASAALTQTGDTTWTLAKTGTVDTGTSTVTWTITATPVATVAGHLVVDGFMTIRNRGGEGATIGNIVVNLQTRAGRKWVTRSSDVADATDGDAATTAHVVPQASSEHRWTFTEDAASGQLLFRDASTNSAFSLVPQVTIAPGATVHLLYSAAFDNNMLGLAVRTPVRVEVIVSFGNAGPSGPSAPQIDINGNGAIDADEYWVRSVPTRIGLKVPAETPVDTPVTLTDAIGDVSTTGTVTMSSAVFDIGATSGTVVVTVSGGADGGTITNCAHLGGTGVALEACDTQAIAPDAFEWQDGDAITYMQGAWGADPNPTNQAGLLAANFSAVFGSEVEIGVPGAAGYSIVFTNVIALLQFLPASGTPAPLTSDFGDPASTMAGAFAGHVMALRINVAFADAGLTAGTSPVPFGDFVLCNLPEQPLLEGLSVRQFLAEAESTLGSGPSLYSAATMSGVAAQLTSSFVAGIVQPFAVDHLAIGSCP